MFEHRTLMVFPRVRAACPRCGPQVELLRWLDPHLRVTRRLGESVARLCKRVLWVRRGRGHDDIRPFFELLGGERCARTKAAVVDMNAGYQLEIKQHCPNAAIAFDRFHAVAKYGREVIDRVRVDRANDLRHDRRGRRIVKGARWPLLKNRYSLRSG